MSVALPEKTEMYSSEDLEKFYFDYQTEWMPRGMSIQAYCSRNNVPYKILDKWIRDIYKRVVPVEVAGAPEHQHPDSAMPSEVQEKQTDVSNEKVSVKVIISTSSGLEISRCGLDYPGLRSFINKLEGLLC